jgi:hypothetical protein
MSNETYISIDIETDGPCPGINSMLSLGAAVFRLDGQEMEHGLLMGRHWAANLLALPEGQQNPDTMKWWKTQPDAWAELEKDVRNPAEAMPDFVLWCNQWRTATAPGKLVAVAWPAAFDFSFVNYYCWRFAGENPLGFACMDIRSYAAGLVDSDHYYRLPESEIKAIAGQKQEGLQDHHALDDAIDQADLMKALLRAAQTRS